MFILAFGLLPSSNAQKKAARAERERPSDKERNERKERAERKKKAAAAASRTTLRPVKPGPLQASEPVSSQAVGFAETERLSEIAGRALPAKKAGEEDDAEENEAAENRSIKHPTAEALARASIKGGIHKDPVVQTTIPAPNMPAPGTQFDGLNNSDNAAILGGRFTPPDTDGSVGPNHFVQQINDLVRVYDKSGTPLTPAFKLSALFASIGGQCSVQDAGDPVVLYDQLADRWMLSQFAFASQSAPPYHQCIAISKTPDPTGAYFAYDFITAGNEFPDYPKLGLWPDGYYMMVHQFTDGGPFNGTGVYSFDRVKMIAGNPFASYIYFNRNLANFPEGYGGLLPSSLDGLTPPPAGRPNTFAYFTSLDFPDPADGLRLFDFHADFATPANSTFTERAETTYAAPLPVAAFSTITPTGNGGRRAVPQPAPATVTSGVDAITDRLMHRMQYRNQGGYETLVMNHTVGAPGSTTFGTFRAAPRYYELRSTAGGPFMVQEQATFAPADGVNRWMGSAAEDNQGNLAIGYSVSSDATGGNVFPGIRYAGRLATDPANGLFQGEATLIAGTGRQTDTTNNRWGDYSGMSLDPTDDCTFWYTQMYYTAASQATSGVGFLTRIGSFKFPTCTAPAKGTVHFTITNCVTNALIANASISIDGTAYGASLTSGIYDGILAPGSHTYSITKLGHSVATGNFSITNGNTTNVPVCLDSGTVHFIVTDCATTNPISGAAVTIDATLYGNTAVNGTLDGDATPGSHTFTVTKLHYANGTGNFNIIDGQNTNQPVCLNGLAEVAITKTADGVSVVAGSQVGFNVTLTNSGVATATGLAVTDSLPGGASTNWSVDGANSDAGWSVSGSPPSQNLLYTPTTLAASSSTHVHVISGTSGVCASTVSLNNTASFTTTNDGSGNASASIAVLCPPVSPGPVTITASAGTPGPTDYPTVKAAFDAINAGTHQGAIAIWIFGNTSEAVAAVLNGSGTGSALYTSILMLPSGGARTVTGALATPLIDLSGAKNVTIDGQNTGGNSLTLSNTSTAATAGTSTIRFINGASNNVVTNCAIQGSSSGTAAAAGGNVLFSTSTVAGGNSNNTVSNNNIGPAGANTPSKGVMGLGSASPNNNTGNVISGNNIFDYFLAGTGNTAGVSIQANNTNWTISNNRMYQTATRTFTGTAGVRYSGILVASAGNTFTITGNTIGFGAANGTGTTTITGTGTGLGNEFRGIVFTNSSTATYSSIQGNTISGINQTSSRGSATTDLSPFIGIQSGSSATDAPANIGNVTGNTIGSLDGSSTIVINASSTTVNNASVQGILDFNFVDAVNTSNNKIGSITINNGGTGTTVGFRGIIVGSTTGVTHTLTNNIVGGTAAGSITDNIVGSYAMYGIQVSAANGVITGNTVRNLTGNSNGAALVVGAGILTSGSTGANTISLNTIHSLSNASGAASNSLYAISCSLPIAASVVERNLIHSLSMTSSVTTGQLVGIISSNAVSTATYKNNMVRLGIDATGSSITTGLTIIGLWDGAGTNNFYFNSVYIGGSGVVSASNTNAFLSQVTTNTRNYKDNIFWNDRSNASGTGKNYAINVAGTTPNPAGLSINYNDLYATGTGSFVGLFNTADQTALSDWQTAVGQDANSISGNPKFVAPTAPAATVDLHLLSVSPAQLTGTPIAGVTNDIDNDARPPVKGDMGADQLTPPSAAGASIRGTITDSSGAPVGGVTMNLNGAQARETITDSNGNYSFAEVAVNGFYTVTPALANYTFAPTNRSFSLVANKADAIFTAAPDATASSNAIDTNEYFIRQQYLDFLGREPDQAGFDYWTGKLNLCNGEANCQRQSRLDVAAAFFMSQEFQDTGSYVYRLYNGALGRQVNFNEFSTDRQRVLGGANLDSAKTAFANAFVARAELAQKYQASTTAESFVDALLQTIREATGADLSGVRANLVSRYQSGGTMNESRALALRDVAENATMGAAVYNPSFVAMEYFGYLRRGIDQYGYNFWLNALNTTGAGNYRGMVCSFITSTEYQQRFGNVVTRSNSECSGTP
jgi:hypothetical protein